MHASHNRQSNRPYKEGSGHLYNARWKSNVNQFVFFRVMPIPNLRPRACSGYEIAISEITQF